MTSLSWITLLAFVLSVAFCMAFRGLAREWYLIDLPDYRKRHEGAVPLCGGIAIFLSFFLTASLVKDGAGHADALVMMPGLTIILGTGVLDDRFRLPVTPRFAIQLFAAVLIIAMAGVQQVFLDLNPSFIDDSGNIFAFERLGGPFLLLFAVAFIVGLVNAVNMSDGVDGLAGSASAASFFWLAVISFDIGEHRLGLQSLALVAACLGFLVFNMRHRWRAKASLFLGDGGSTLLGAALAGIVLILSSGRQATAFPVLLWIVIVPVLDTLSLIVRRLAARRSPFSADRQHLHHLLMDAGLTCGQTAIIVMALNLIAGATAYTAIRLDLPGWLMALALLAPAMAHLAFILRCTRGPRIADPAQAAKPNITFPGTTT